MKLRPTAEFKIARLLEEGAYELWTIYHPELGFPTYGIVNKEYDIIEHLQPNFHNAKNVMKEFNAWLDNKHDVSVHDLEEIDLGGKTPN